MVKPGIQTTDFWLTLAVILVNAALAGTSYLAETPEELESVIAAGKIGMPATWGVVGYVFSRHALKGLNDYLATRKIEAENAKPIEAPKPDEELAERLRRLRQEGLDELQEQRKNAAADRAAAEERLAALDRQLAELIPTKPDERDGAQ